MWRASGIKAAALGVLTMALASRAVGGNADDLTPLRIKSTVNIPKIAAPSLDGKLRPEEYARAQPLRHWGARSQAAITPTEAFVGRDDEYLYIAARCFDTHLDELVTASAAIWMNDCIEMFVDVDKKTLFYSHITADCAAAATAKVWTADEWNEPTRGPNVEVKAKSGREKDAWTVELAVP